MESAIKSELVSAKYALASLWSGDESEVGIIKFPAKQNMRLYPIAVYLKKIGENWDLKVIQHSGRVAKAEVQLANSKRYPDVTVGVGVEHFFQNSQPKSHNAAIVEFSVPIPIFDRNQGNVAVASENYKKSLDIARNQELTLQASIVRVYQAAAQAKLQLNTLNNSILPQSVSTLKLARHGYEQGRYSYLDLLSAQQKYIDAQMRQVSARFQYYRAWYALQILTGSLPQGGQA
jgi:cobalt-zinc-cadmium efflux system outer membrane protein